MKGRVIVCAEYGKPFEIQEYDVPEPAPRRDAASYDPGGHLRL